jgi:hypothetical protein
MCVSEFGVRGYVVQVNHDIVCADFPIGKSPTGVESVDFQTHRGSGFWLAREPFPRVSQYCETRFPDKAKGRSSKGDFSGY